MKKEKHKWKKVKERRYINLIGEPEHHYIIINEYFECEICGAKKLK